MLFFRPSAGKNFHWLMMSIGLVVSAVVSTTAIAYVKKSPSNTKNAANNAQTIPNNVVIDKVFVDKSKRTLQLLSNDKMITSYHIALGDSPAGHKQQQGDERTPVGSYKLDYKNEKSKFYRSIHISYSNAADKVHAKKLGVSPGGDIMIHGQKNGFGHLASVTQQRTWTDGCIAVTNDEMDQIMEAVEIGTAIEIIE
ncbi:L,D-transpeptidase family protein [Psychrobacter sp. LV10R520-6]|uniref:L,D-transpeptidase family protein n=1 Tax=Psychrobacter sp. LV10R520-6 TaxID=1415574 RepID=UPI0024C5F87B|nr:L,D-transpeptidase family protein [Psychrobacter sp. LV10R520-6]SNT70172.1 L,D-transpeptidase catalytic domain [Psychrobacter sp. LV10R520-6]